MVVAQAHEAKSKAKMKCYSDQRRNAKPHSFATGDCVLLDQTKGKKIYGTSGRVSEPTTASAKHRLTAAKNDARTEAKSSWSSMQRADRDCAS
jgi:hypothetical protein